MIKVEVKNIKKTNEHSFARAEDIDVRDDSKNGIFVPRTYKITFEYLGLEEARKLRDDLQLLIDDFESSVLLNDGSKVKVGDYLVKEDKFIHEVYLIQNNTVFATKVYPHSEQLIFGKLPISGLRKATPVEINLLNKAKNTLPKKIKRKEMSLRNNDLKIRVGDYIRYASTSEDIVMRVTKLHEDLTFSSLCMDSYLGNLFTDRRPTNTASCRCYRKATKEEIDEFELEEFVQK